MWFIISPHLLTYSTSAWQISHHRFFRRVPISPQKLAYPLVFSYWLFRSLLNQSKGASGRWSKTETQLYIVWNDYPNISKKMIFTWENRISGPLLLFSLHMVHNHILFQFFLLCCYPYIYDLEVKIYFLKYISEKKNIFVMVHDLNKYVHLRTIKEIPHNIKIHHLLFICWQKLLVELHRNMLI